METAILITIITVIATVLQIILFFKVWRMTNDVNKLKQHITADVGDEYMRCLRHYTSSLDFIKSLLTTKEGTTINSNYDNYVMQEWVENYSYVVKGHIFVLTTEGYCLRIVFHIDAVCDGNPRIKSNWKFSLNEERTEIPAELRV